jgi:hypothetical protein
MGYQQQDSMEALSRSWRSTARGMCGQLCGCGCLGTFGDSIEGSFDRCGRVTAEQHLPSPGTFPSFLSIAELCFTRCLLCVCCCCCPQVRAAD